MRGVAKDEPLPETPLTDAEYQGLAAFRHALRRFLAFSEARAREVGLTPQQHQALLSIKGGYPGRDEISIGELAGHLLLKNHSTVELVDRLVKGGFVSRRAAPDDRRRILLRVTGKGETVLRRISNANLAELAAAAPLMAGFLGSLDER
jgi:DNA-binding MarR family transcriptional regulator